METKIIEVRDKGTFLPVLAIKMQALTETDWYFIHGRCGYASRKPFTILLTDLNGGRKACSDPYDWNDRTLQTAHVFIQANWDGLHSGDVVDVQVILGETEVSKISERITSPLTTD